MIKLKIDNVGTELKHLTDFLSSWTHKEIDGLLTRSGMEIVGTPFKYDGQSLKYGTSKKDKLYNSFITEINKSKNYDKIIRLIESIYNPANYINDTSVFNNAVDDINPILAMMGVSINNCGKIVEVAKPQTIDEIDRRFNTLKNEIDKRRLHSQVHKYCKKEYLAKDYFHTIHEAVKGVLERIREITSSNKDGYELLDEVLNHKNPVLVFNKLSNDNELNEYKGFRRIIEGLITMFRNPTAHIPRIKYNEDINITLEVLSTISMVHRYLDNCQVARSI